MATANSVEIKLLGQKIILKSPSSDSELIREVSQLVTARLKESEAKGKSVPHHVALLALFNLAEEYVQSKRRVASQKREMEQKSEELLRLIEAEFK